MVPEQDSGSGFNAEAFLRKLTHKPGVYRMLDEADKVIYVGKARDLKKRVASYFGAKAHHPKTMALMARMQNIEVTVTSNEQEALMLEYNLNSGYLVTNFHKAGAFLARHKISTWPGRVKKIDRLRRMFDRIAKEEEWPE